MIKYFLIVFSLTGQGTMQMRGDLEVKTMDENAACYPVTQVEAYE